MVIADSVVRKSGAAAFSCDHNTQRVIPLDHIVEKYSSGFRFDDNAVVRVLSDPVLRSALRGAVNGGFSDRQSEGLFWDSEELQDLALEVGKLRMEDLHDLIVMQEDVTLRVAE